MSEEGKLIAVLPKNSTEQIQIAIKEYKEKKYLDLRVYYTKEGSDEWLPTKKGITVMPENFEVLQEAIEQAISEFQNEV